MIKLSIIIPYYQVLNEKLFEKLSPQLNNEVEVIVVDDGCNDLRLDKLPAKVIHLPTNSGGASVPRNVGLDNASGEYIAFIDADDYVYDNYIEKIMQKISEEDFDYCYLSWKSICNTVVIASEPPQWNCCVWNCIYKKALIGENRFDPTLKIAEDFDFNERVRRGKRANIVDIIYFYDTEANPHSLIKSV